MAERQATQTGERSAGGGGPITLETLGVGLAESFRDGTALCESKQALPPPMGLPTQAVRKPGQRNYSRLTREEQDKGVRAIPTTARPGGSPRQYDSRYARNLYGKPIMRPATELPTTEALVLRTYAVKCQKAGDPEIKVPETMVFATTGQANAVNLAYGGNKRTDQQMLVHVDRKAPVGIDFDMRPPDDGMFRVTSHQKDEAGNLVRDAKGLPVRVTVEKPRDPGMPAPARKTKTLYSVDDLRIDTAPVRIGVRPGMNHDEKGNEINPVSGDVVRNAKGEVAVWNHDRDGKRIEGVVGAVRRTETGEPIRASVVQLGRRSNVEEPVKAAIELGYHRLKEGLTASLEREGVAQPIEITRDRRVNSAVFSAVEKDGKAVPTITLPTKFRDQNHELTEVSRAVSHAYQWQDRDCPTHAAAQKAAAMPPRNRAKSAEFAQCELVAQHAAMANVTRAGGVYQPQPKAANDQCREHWAKYVEKDVADFGRATDRASRVCAGKEPTRSLENERRLEVKRDAAAQQLEQQRQARSQSRTRTRQPTPVREQQPAPDMGRFTGAVRGADQPTGGAQTRASGGVKTRTPEKARGEAPARAAR